MEYRASIASVSALLQLETAYPDPPPTPVQAEVEGLRGGASVMMVAAFERYVRDAVTESLEGINGASPACQFDKLPDDIQVAVVFSSLNLAMKGDHATAGRPRKDRLTEVFRAVGRLHARTIDARAVAQTAGNPDSKQLRAIYRSIGLPNVFSNINRSFVRAWGAPVASTFITDQLDIVVKRRHSVAHTASVLNITRSDLAEGHRFLQTLVGVLDAALDRHVARVIAAAQ